MHFVKSYSVLGCLLTPALGVYYSMDNQDIDRMEIPKHDGPIYIQGRVITVLSETSEDLYRTRLTFCVGNSSSRDLLQKEALIN